MYVLHVCISKLDVCSMYVEEEEIYICSSRLELNKMDHHHSGNGRNSQQQTAQQKVGRPATETAP